VGGPAPVCDDGNPCTDDSCDAATGCTFAFNVAPCDDGDRCTDGDACHDGACQAGPPVVCNDASACTVDSCAPALGCVFDSVCHVHADCVDEACQCADGYEGDGVDCSDIDECAQETDDCDEQASCENEAGGYGCTCNPGYSGDGFACTPNADCGDGVCDSSESYASCESDCRVDLLVVVEESLESALQASLEQYRADLQQAGLNSRIVTFAGGSTTDLRALLADEWASAALDGALLVGDLPAAWFEQTAFETWEEFPIDLYLEDLDATFSDSNSNNRFDGHSPAQLQLEIFVSRLTGTATELQEYFAKNHAYRSQGSLAPESAWVFVDDDWYGYFPGAIFLLDQIYGSCEVCEALNQTTRANYVAKMTSGAEFVYQWIHSYPDALWIAGAGEGIVSTSDLVEIDAQASFLNMFDCSAARFTEENLGMTYVVRTSYGLAVHGSTKTGGDWQPEWFHGSLAEGSTWGSSFRAWYNQLGSTSDEWYLGMVILGDPMLILNGTVRGQLGTGQSVQWEPAAIRAMGRRMADFARGQRLGSFAEYRAAHPSFFP
jgi:hypothetical protein